MGIRAVFFDWDGTLVRGRRESPPETAATLAAYAKRNLNDAHTAADFERALMASSVEPRGDKAVAPGIGAILAATFAWLGIAVSARDIEACSRLVFRAETDHLRLYEDAEPLLLALQRRGYRMGVVSNAVFPGEFMARKANELGIGRLIHTVVSSADVGVKKPAPGIFERALKSAGVGHHEALFVGDTVETDVHGARGAGMRAVLVERTLRSHHASGYLVVERLSELNEILGDSLVA